jgi:hypothetical protein
MNWYKRSQVYDSIIAAAIKLGDKVYSVPRPGRHHNVIQQMRQQGVGRGDIAQGIQGFLTQSGQFLDRIEAAKLALSNGQVSHSTELFSEDLW